MANLIEATVYQIDGNPQMTPITVAFDTNKIRLQETTVSTIPQVVSFIEVEGEKLNAPVVKYFVSETVATLVSAANTGGTTLLQATVVAINENPFKVAKQMAFPANKVTVWSFSNGNIQSFLQLNEDKFYATEDKANLVGAANAGGGISLATNGLSIYDDVALGLGGTLTQEETIINGNTFLWRTASLNDNTQGFNLNFDSQVYSFGVIENEELHSYIEFGDSYIQNVVSDDNNATYLTQFQSIDEFYLDIGVIVGEQIYNWNPFVATQSYTYIRHNNTDFESEAYNTIQGQFKITANAENFTLHYNFINIPAYANNAAALAANLVVGDIYRGTTGGGDTLHIVH